jgi:hypothetical protein
MVSFFATIVNAKEREELLKGMGLLPVHPGAYHQAERM